MSLHFSREEFTNRQSRAIAVIEERDLDGLLMFRQESMYYLTGFDTAGYVMFQCLYLGGDGTLMLLTRLPDLRQAQFTSTIEDIRIWGDSSDADPVRQLKDLLEDLGCRGKRLGIEIDAWCLNGKVWDRLEATFDGFCKLEDATDLINHLRLAKSPAEIDYVNRAAELGDEALSEGNRLALPGAFEGDIMAAMQGKIFQGGGDYPNDEMVLGSGPGALMVRGFSKFRNLDPNDQLQLEFASVYRHYHACLMRTVLIGKVSGYQCDMHKACCDALKACQETCKPGATMGDVFDAHAQIFDKAGFKEHRLNACGYSLGATFQPEWMDWPMFYTGNPVVIGADMVFFMHMILLDSDRGVTMSLGETVRVTETACESLSNMHHDLVIN